MTVIQHGRREGQHAKHGEEEGTLFSRMESVSCGSFIVIPINTAGQLLCHCVAAFEFIESSFV